MLCKNCNYILTGKENFCPNCSVKLRKDTGESTKEKEELKSEIKEIKEDETDKANLFKEKEKPTADRGRNVQIFYDSQENEDYEPVESKTKGSAGKIFLLIFVIAAFLVATFGVADYFGVTTSVFSFIQTVASSKEEKSLETFDASSSILAPEINYSPSPAYVMSGNGLTLRKGPGNSYAPAGELSELTAVRILGGSMENKNWVYAYCEEEESYGWLDSSFLATEDEEEIFTFSEKDSSADEQNSQANDILTQNNR